MQLNAIDLCLGCMQDKSGHTICPGCQFNENQHINPAPCLALGTQLNNQYVLGRMLGHGGFGITYLAWDSNLQAPVAIKEYWPRDYGQRDKDGVAFSCYHDSESANLFAYGRNKFIEEARKLARFEEHPGIINVHNLFESNGIPYMVMQYVKGIDLKQYLAINGDRIPIDAALHLITPVLDGLRAIHQRDILHRDISPDNIYITQASRRVILLDFGAAKDSFSHHSKSQAAVRKPGYSAKEQYISDDIQAPCTDIYATAATIYRMITGQTPPDAMERLTGEPLIPPSQLGAIIQPYQEKALLKALEIECQERFQTAAAFQEALKKPNLIVGRSVSTNKNSQDSQHLTKPKPYSYIRTYCLIAILVLTSLLAGLVWMLFTQSKTPQQTPQTPQIPVIEIDNKYKNKANILTDKIFHKRHPELQGRNLQAEESLLIAEWRKIRACEVVNQIVDSIFYSKHPELQGRTILAYTQLSNEWLAIKTAIVGSDANIKCLR